MLEWTLSLKKNTEKLIQNERIFLDAKIKTAKKHIFQMFC